MLKKKCRTILLPYFLWNVIIFFAFFICQKISFLRQYFATIIIDEMSWKDFAGLFTGRISEGAEGLFPPLVYQFWFLRELFFCIILSPVVKKLTEKVPLFYGAFIIFMINSNLFYGGFRAALFYFSLSAFSFWLYATHDPFLITPIKKLWTKFLPINGYFLVAEYFGAVILTVVISLAVGMLLKKIFPRVFAVLTGGR